MVLDSNFRQIFVLGRYLERGMRATPENTRSDFYVYDIDNAKWTMITDDTAGMGGPSLIFDHQMCLDPVKRHIFVFGGQTLPLHPTEERPVVTDKKFSGLFVYQIPDNTWKLLWEDGEVKTAGFPPLRSRTGHSMLFNSSDRNLYIFGGQRKKDEYMNDFLTYNVDTGGVKFLSRDGNCTAQNLPAVGYTQRATIDCKRNEIYVMTGLNKDKGKETRSGDCPVSNSFWVYEISAGRWGLIYKNENYEPEYWTTRQIIEPRPRYAHQLVYNEDVGVHFMFGGNPGGKENRNGKLRLGDFWRLELERQQNTDLERVLIKEIRKTRYQEKSTDPMAAVSFLQTSLSSCVNHKDVNEEKEFQLLASQLFSSHEDKSHHTLRSDLFDKLVSYFPSNMTQPSGNLLDMLPLEDKSRTK